ncbi:MAG: aldo/keto reductase [Spirochaetaceae bacterium]|nr:aldo/keto reductase [Spirochaetaceae bacterium]MCF7949604.1 aldo/keto reductase [Spirochaetia bacterium]MCF7951512.1 aldo/keto reductase [Spirochaetaceae bacterium]
MNSELGLGCWAFGDEYWSSSDSTYSHRETVRVIRAALRAGIAHFDTAQGYGNGVSEQVTGQQLRQIRRSVSIASKTYLRPASTVEQGIEKSLRRLCTDYIDIFYLHWPKPSQDLRPQIEALERARQKGYIRAIGLSNFSAPQIQPLLSAGQIDYCQFGYSLLWRTAELSLVPFCRKHNIRMVSYSSLAQGLLAHPPGWAESLPPEDPRHRLLFLQPEVSPRLQPILQQLWDYSRKIGITGAQLALAWNLSRPWNRYTLFGARRPSQVEECSQAGSIHLPPELIEKIDALTTPLLHLWPESENIFGHRP